MNSSMFYVNKSTWAKKLNFSRAEYGVGLHIRRGLQGDLLWRQADGPEDSGSWASWAPMDHGIFSTNCGMVRRLHASNLIRSLNL